MGIKFGVCNQYSTSNIIDHWRRSVQSPLPTLSVWTWASHLTRTVYYFHKHTSRLGISSGYEGLMMANTWSEKRESRAWWPERRRGRISWYSDISPGQWTTSWIWSWGRAPVWPCFEGDPEQISMKQKIELDLDLTWCDISPSLSFLFRRSMLSWICPTWR